MKKGLFWIALFSFSMLAACGNSSDESGTSLDTAQLYTTEESEADFSLSMENRENANKSAEPQEVNISDTEEIKKQLERKVIYTAHLQIEVKSYQETANRIQAQVEKLQGYTVESTMFEDPENASKHGQITVRIPVEKFSEFIKFVEAGSSKVLESSTSGQDVTEEYIDLDSRLQSKRVVEKRLLAFMEKAEKTEDLLKISNDLAKVQEEIEEITGRMKYLQNKSDLATVSIYIQENNITLTGTGKDNLNTWEQTKQQFMKSINFMIHAFSSIIIFFIGNLPVLLSIGAIGLVLFLIGRNRWKKRKRTSDSFKENN